MITVAPLQINPSVSPRRDSRLASVGYISPVSGSKRRSFCNNTMINVSFQDVNVEKIRRSLSIHVNSNTVFQVGYYTQQNLTFLSDESKL